MQSIPSLSLLSRSISLLSRRVSTDAYFLSCFLARVMCPMDAMWSAKSSAVLHSMWQILQKVSEMTTTKIQKINHFLFFCQYPFTVKSHYTAIQYNIVLQD